MITTFYSYKGGVGRSLALANVAWLLANHATEPARVLVVDFDLNAPGLHKVFGVADEASLPGIVDFIHRYVYEARVDAIEAYIHRTSYDNIDILPAGSFGPQYQAFLEQINWSTLYEEAHGYELLNKFKQMIEEVTPKYDYILIDSLTGYSDVGGICVRQLPEAVVLLFRLNDQNLDGIGTVYKSLRSAPKEETTPVIPVITPAWPFIAAEAKEWYAKAEAVFPSETLSSISFDAGLSFGESIISNVSSHELKSQVRSDYQSLSLRIRALNSGDPLTMWNSLREENSTRLPDSLEKYRRLLSLRPNNETYWQFLPSAVFANRPFGFSRGSGTGGDPLFLFGDFVNKLCEAGNKFALVARARYESAWKESTKRDPVVDLNRALEIDPRFTDALISRGQFYQTEKKPEKAIADFEAALEVLKPKDKKRAVIHECLGGAYLDIYESAKAIEQYSSALVFSPRDGDLYAGLCRAYYLDGQYEKALLEIDRFKTIDGGDKLTGELLPIQITAALGKVQEASAALEELISTKAGRKDTNIAEAYLAVSPEVASRLLNGITEGKNETPVSTLRIVAKILTGEIRKLNSEHLTSISSDRTSKRIRWNGFEVVAMLRAAERANRFSKSQISLAMQVISKLGPMLPTFELLTMRNFTRR